MEKLINLLKLFGVSGYEEKTGAYIVQEAEKYADSVKTDIMGNITALKKGSEGKQKIMLCTSIDQSGFIITVKDGNVLRFGGIGSCDPDKLCGRTAEFENGAKGIIGCDTDENIKIKNLYADIIDGSADIGDVFTLADNPCRTGKYITSSRLSSRLGAYVLLRLMEQIKDNKNDIYFVFAVQGELAFRGSRTAAFNAAPDAAITVGTVSAHDMPGKEKNGISLDKGPAIIIKDSSILAHPRIKSSLADSAQKQGIQYQAEVSHTEQSEGGVIHLSGGGITTGGVNIPLRYKGSETELCLIKNIEDTIKLIAGCDLI